MCYGYIYMLQFSYMIPTNWVIIMKPVDRRTDVIRQNFTKY